MKFAAYLSKQLDTLWGVHVSVVPVATVLRTTSEYFVPCSERNHVVDLFIDFLYNTRYTNYFYSVEHTRSASAINVLARLVGTSDFVQIARFEYNKKAYDF